MAEIRGSFGSADDWNAWRHDLGEIDEVRLAILDDIRSLGYVEPMTDIARYPYQIAIRDDELHESISSHRLNSRKRALLLQLVLELQARNWMTRQNIRILGAEAVSRVALILRGKYPYYLGTEYLPNEAAQLKYFPVPHMDLQRIDYPAESFDVFTSGGVLERIPDLGHALMEIHRVLKPGGVMVSYFPFDPGRFDTFITVNLHMMATRSANLTARRYFNCWDGICCRNCSRMASKTHTSRWSPHRISVSYPIPNWVFLF